MQSMERTLKRVGGSVMVPVPPEILKEMGLEEGQQVRLVSEGGHFRVEPAVSRPSPEAVEFASCFTRKYDEMMKNLANR